MNKKQELKNYVINSIVHNAFDPNELLRLINLLPDQPQINENQQNLIIWMQENECETNDPLESISDLFLEAEASSCDGWENCLEAAYKSLTNRQKVEMVQDYLSRYLEQEVE